MRTGCLLGWNKSSLRLLIIFITGHCKIRSLTVIPDNSRTIAGYGARRSSWRLSSTSFVTVQHLVGWRPLAGVSLRVWISCREPTSRLSTDSLLAWDGWEVLGLHQCSLPFLFCFGLCNSSASHSPFPTSSLFSYPHYYPSF